MRKGTSYICTFVCKQFSKCVVCECCLMLFLLFAFPLPDIQLQVDIASNPLQELNGNHSDLTLREKEWLFHQHGIEVVYMANPSRQKVTAGTILQRCLTEITKFRKPMNRAVCVFKAGLTTDPVVRFGFYRDANYERMVLLHVTENMGVAQVLEAALIAPNLKQVGCGNEKFGGEGPLCKSLHGKTLHFFYVFGARADQMKPIG